MLLPFIYRYVGREKERERGGRYRWGRYIARGMEWKMRGCMDVWRARAMT